MDSSVSSLIGDALDIYGVAPERLVVEVTETIMADKPEIMLKELASLRRLGVQVSEAEKCERCWHRRPEVGSSAKHPTLCGRCEENVDGDGEQRHFA